MYCPFCAEKIEDDTKICSNCNRDISNAKNDDNQLPIGSMLGNRYYIGAVIRQGGFGITYIGCDTKINKKVAIKEYYPSSLVSRVANYSQDISISAGSNSAVYDKQKQRFISEASILAKLSSERNIVNVTDIFSEHNTCYMVMEYVEGEDLDDYLKKCGRLTFSDAFAMMKPIMESLIRVHERGLIHRDISPSNIKVLPDNKTLILLDFGAAREFDQSEGKSLSVILKPGYAPAEQYQTHGEQGPWTDVYAICATMYKMITGITPANAIDRIVADTLKKPSEVGAVISSNQERILVQGLEVIQNKRIASMRELLNAFENDSTYQGNQHIMRKESQTQTILDSSVEKTTVLNVKNQETIILMPNDENRAVSKGMNQPREVKKDNDLTQVKKKNNSVVFALVGIATLIVVASIILGVSKVNKASDSESQASLTDTQSTSVSDAEVETEIISGETKKDIQPKSRESDNDSNNNHNVADYKSSAEIAFDEFISGKREAYKMNGDSFTIDDLDIDGEDFESYSIGQMVDLDNDGEYEQIFEGMYGGFYLDAQGPFANRLVVFAQGEGMTGILSYVQYEGATWIVHSDTSHVGRQIFELTKYSGGNKVIDSCELVAIYSDGMSEKYDENSEFEFRNEKITMEEYESIRKDIMGY